MASRMELQAELKEILGSENVYFQPPATITLKYPCIVYNLTNARSTHANGRTYNVSKEYSVLLIHRNPDNDIVDKLIARPLCRLTNTYVSDNLHHYAFTLFNDN